jgi:hypothetical protein
MQQEDYVSSSPTLAYKVRDIAISIIADIDYAACAA